MNANNLPKFYLIVDEIEIARKEIENKKLKNIFVDILKNFDFSKSKNISLFSLCLSINNELNMKNQHTKKFVRIDINLSLFEKVLKQIENVESYGFYTKELFQKLSVVQCIATAIKKLDWKSLKNDFFIFNIDNVDSWNNKNFEFLEIANNEISFFKDKFFNIYIYFKYPQMFEQIVLL
jgi:hypothetical protein